MKNKEELEKIIDNEIERLLDLDIKNMFTLKIFIFETIIPEVIKEIILKKQPQDIYCLATVINNLMRIKNTIYLNKYHSKVIEKAS